MWLSSILFDVGIASRDSREKKCLHCLRLFQVSIVSAGSLARADKQKIIQLPIRYNNVAETGITW